MASDSDVILSDGLFECVGIKIVSDVMLLSDGLFECVGIKTVSDVMLF